MVFDVIVCGGGVQGLWTAKYLAEKNQKVLLLEQFPFPHTRGSSHGPSRIIRYSYTTPHHAKMMPEAYERWNELEISQKKKLFVNCGLICVARPRHLSNIERSLGSTNIPYESLKSEDIPQRFPGMTGRDYCGVFEKSAGVLKANQCLLALQSSFLSLGGVMHDGEKVEAIDPINSRKVKVVTNGGTYEAKSIVLTCGAWINKILMPLNLHLPVQPKRVISEYWEAKDPQLFSANNFPTTILKPDDGFRVYSTPILEYPGLMKVSCHSGADVDPDEPNCCDDVAMETRQKFLTEAVENFFPNLKPVPVVKEYCMYSETPDLDFILDHHPMHRNVIIGAGFSGHGFKLSPTVGCILGDLAMGKAPAYDMAKFSLKRFKQENPKL